MTVWIHTCGCHRVGALEREGGWMVVLYQQSRGFQLRASTGRMTENQVVKAVPILCHPVMYRPGLLWKVATGVTREVVEFISCIWSMI